MSDSSNINDEFYELAKQPNSDDWKGGLSVNVDGNTILNSNCNANLNLEINHETKPNPFTIINFTTNGDLTNDVSDELAELYQNEETPQPYMSSHGQHQSPTTRPSSPPPPYPFEDNLEDDSFGEDDFDQNEFDINIQNRLAEMDRRVQEMYRDVCDMQAAGGELFPQPPPPPRPQNPGTGVSGKLLFKRLENIR
jgi:hypothetical protein